jgi:hypothetical protein
MVWWHVLGLIILAKVLGKKLKKWADDPDVKREFGELIEAIDKAYADRKISFEEILEVIREAKDVLREILE